MADEATKRMLRTRVMTILRSPPTRKIDFRLRQWHINSISFAKVADAIELEIVDVDVDVRAGAEALYNYGTDTIGLRNVGYGTDAFSKAVIVHECVHAYIDSFPGGRINVSANEAAGWVAYGLYLLFLGSNIQPVSKSRHPLFIPPLIATPRPTADEVTLKIANKIKNTPGAAVTPTDEQELRTAIIDNLEYASKGITLETQRDNTDVGWSRRESVKIKTQSNGDHLGHERNTPLIPCKPSRMITVKQLSVYQHRPPFFGARPRRTLDATVAGSIGGGIYVTSLCVFSKIPFAFLLH
jgi:hypothetical protein